MHVARVVPRMNIGAVHTVSVLFTKIKILTTEKARGSICSYLRRATISKKKKSYREIKDTLQLKNR
jgi:hypothetical protein